MDEPTFKQRSERLIEIAKVLEKLPAEIRQDAFSLLKSYVSGVHDSHAKAGTPGEPDKPDASPEDREAFFTKFDSDKPADNVKLIAAYWFSQYGVSTFTLDGLNGIANDVGLTVPARPEMTLSQAQNDGKALFQRAGRGQWKPTVHGEAYLKTTYSVTKGRQSPPEAST